MKILGFRFAVSSILLVLFLSPVASAAGRTRPVALPEFFTGPSRLLSSAEPLPGASGYPISGAITPDGQTALAWSTLSGDAVYVGIENAHPFGILIPDVPYREVALATNGTSVMVAWVSSSAIHTGLLSDEGLTPVATIPFSGSLAELRLVSDGDRYLAGWIEQEGAARNRHFVGAIFDSSAALIKDKFDLAPYACVYRGHLGGGSGSFLVVVGLDDCSGHLTGDLYMRAVSNEGALGEAYRFGSGWVDATTEITWNGSEYLFFWGDLPFQKWNLSRVSPEGRITATAKTDQYPAYLTGAGGENRLIVSTDDGGLASTTLTAALTPSGETIDLIPSTLNRVEIFLKRGDDLRIVWSRMDCESCNSRLFSTTTSVSSGEVRASSEAFLRLRERAHPSVAETDGTYLVTWEEEKDDRTGSRVVFIVGDGETWSLPEEAATSGSSQHEPAVAGKDGAFLLTWVEGGWGPSSSLKARVFRPGSAGQFLALGTGVSGPSVTAGPGGFLLAWNSYSAGQLRTVPVSTDGTAGAVQTPHQGLLFFPGGEPRLAPLGDGFLMTFETLVNCSRHGCTSASLLVHLDSQGAATGEPFLLTPDSQGRKAPDVATLGELSQILEWGEPSGDVTAYPTAVFTRTVAPAIGEPVLLDRMEGRPFRWVRESGAIAAAGDQFLAAWITPDSRRLMLSSIRNGLPSDPMDLGAAVEYVDIAGGEGEALIVYTAPRRDGEYGSSLQVFARRIRTGGAAGMSGDAKQKSMPAGYSRGQ